MAIPANIFGICNDLAYGKVPDVLGLAGFARESDERIEPPRPMVFPGTVKGNSEMVAFLLEVLRVLRGERGDSWGLQPASHNDKQFHHQHIKLDYQTMHMIVDLC